jgi:hypothetical protein
MIYLIFIPLGLLALMFLVAVIQVEVKNYKEDNDG